jgi:pimeloyl-ACP methyl ester carboxylesterase
MKLRLITALLCATSVASLAQDTLTSITTTDDVPQTFEALWADFDPQKEPLDVEILQEWEEDGVVMQVVRYRVGIFKGQKAMMAAVYGYPKGGTKLPGLVQIHGGGQSGDYKACLTNAKRGYATISLAWAGRMKAKDHNVNSGAVKLFWEGDTENRYYKVTTDWGPLDAYHSPGRYGRKFGGVDGDEHTIDAVESPRNSGWFLCTLAARRALTFLEQQPEVDPQRLGVYGHSMGGQITSYTAGTDRRVKAAAPSCGGISYRGIENLNEQLSWGNELYLKNTTCPTVFLSPANDFHGRINYLPVAVSEIQTNDWRVTCGPHHNHNDTAPYLVATQLWFDQYLKGTFEWPATPQTELQLKTTTGVPRLTVSPDRSKQILSVEVYYTQQGGDNESHLNKIHRFWRSAQVMSQGDVLIADLPLYSTDQPLWVYANVHYALDEPVAGANYYYGGYTADRFNVSSLLQLIQPAALQTAGVKPTVKPSKIIEDFKGDWQQEWFSYNTKSTQWEWMTNKLYDPMYQAPALSKLAFDIRSQQAGKLTVSVDDISIEVDLLGGNDWQTIEILPLDLKDQKGELRFDWKAVRILKLLFKAENGDEVITPELRNLHWGKCTPAEFNAGRVVRLEDVQAVDGKIYLDTKYADQVRQDILQPKMNTSFDGGAMVIGDKTYQRGIGTHANSDILFFLDGEYQRFHAEVGVQHGPRGTVRFTVFADGKAVFESGMMLREHAAQVVDLDLTGVSELRLTVDDGGNGKGGDHANWAEAYVTK